MINTVFATKQSMSAFFTEEGKRLAATRLQLPEHRLVRLTNTEADGYQAAQLAIGRKTKPANKPLGGHLKAAKVDYQPQYLREVQLTEDLELKPGSELQLDQIIAVGDTVSATSTSKGKGFSGVMKRHGFGGGPKTHGQSDRHRAPGSIGQGTTPGRVFKGKKMAGRMGGETITVTNLKIVEFDSAAGTLVVSGPIPGHRGSLVKIQVMKKAKVSESKAE